MTVDTDICGLCDKIKNLTEMVSLLLDKYEQLNSELLVGKKLTNI